MTNDPRDPVAGPPGTDDLQFERVEPTAPPPQGLGEPFPATSAAPAAASPGVTVCAACGEPITDAYFEANGKVVCPRCRDAVLASQAAGSMAGRVAAAMTLGIAAGVTSAAMWYGLRVWKGIEHGLLALVVGLLVGGAVRKGSGGRGGRGYQLLAVLITYLSICANYIPDVYRGIVEDDHHGFSVVALVISAVFSLAAPVLRGFDSIWGILIVGFALYEAWAMNRRRLLTFNGPYRLANAQAAAAPLGYVPPPLPPVGGR
jgi:hypothetical protein